MAERVPGPGKCIPEFIKQIHHPVLLDTDDVQRQPGASEVCDQRANWLHQSAQFGRATEGGRPYEQRPGNLLRLATELPYQVE
jgi:hypothetical protein